MSQIRSLNAAANYFSPEQKSLAKPPVAAVSTADTQPITRPAQPRRQSTVELMMRGMATATPAQDAADRRFELRGMLTGGEYNHAAFEQNLARLTKSELKEVEQDGSSVLSVAIVAGNSQAVGLIKAKLRD